MTGVQLQPKHAIANFSGSRPLFDDRGTVGISTIGEEDLSSRPLFDDRGTVELNSQNAIIRI